MENKNKEVEESLKEAGEADEDSKKVIKEMKEEGHFSPGKEDKDPEKPEKPEKPEDEDEEGKGKPKEEPEEKEKKDDKKDDEEGKPEEKEDKKEEKKEEKKEKKDEKEKGDEDEEEEGEDKKPKRTPRMIELHKVKANEKKLTRRAEEAEAKLQEREREIVRLTTELEKKPGDAKVIEKISKAIKEIAEQSGLEEDTLKRLADVVSEKVLSSIPKTGLSAEEKDRIGKIEEELAWRKEEDLFSQEYRKDILPLLKDVPQENRKKIKKLLHGFAFTEEYAKTPLKRIFRFEEFDTLKQAEKKPEEKPEEKKKGRKSAEPSSGGGARGEIVDFDNVTDEDILNMDEKTFEKYSKHMIEKTPKHNITRRPRM